MTKLIYDIDQAPIDVDLNAPNGVKAQLMKYFNYMAEKVGTDSSGTQNRVFVGYTFERNALERILYHEAHYDGIRLCLVKNNDSTGNASDQQDKISLVAIPVRKVDDNTFVDQIAENDIVIDIKCRSTHCTIVNNPSDVVSW